MIKLNMFREFYTTIPLLIASLNPRCSQFQFFWCWRVGNTICWGHLLITDVTAWSCIIINPTKNCCCVQLYRVVTQCNNIFSIAGVITKVGPAAGDLSIQGPPPFLLSVSEEQQMTVKSQESLTRCSCIQSSSHYWCCDSRTVTNISLNKTSLTFWPDSSQSLTSLHFLRI